MNDSFGKKPLSGVRIIEIAGIGPGPFACMLLADLGADIIRIDRPGGSNPNFKAEAKYQVVERGRPTITVDLKQAEGVNLVLSLVEKADALVEGFRPGVAERLGIGPETCHRHNPRLVYGRMTGWGQQGPLAQTAGHDINYLALSGALHAIGPKDGKPVPPLNLVGDYGGGSLYLALGMVSALLQARASGVGQVVDAAVVDGAISLMSMFYGRMAAGQWQDERGANMLDGGLPWYDTYLTADGKYIAIGALEPQFFAVLCEKIGLDSSYKETRHDPGQWPQMRRDFERIFSSRTRDQWCDVLEGTDACFAPVLSLQEAALHPHNRARESLVDIDGVVQPAPAPRFSTLLGASAPTSRPMNSRERLMQWGLDGEQLDRLIH